MNIILFGESPFTHFLSQELLELENVSRVFHYGASPKVYSSSRYHPLFTLEKDIERFILGLPSVYHFDVIFPIGINYQLWKKFRNLMLSLKIPLILPDEKIIKITTSSIGLKKFLFEANIPIANKDMLFKNKFSFFVVCNNKEWKYIGISKNYSDNASSSFVNTYNSNLNEYVTRIVSLMRLKNFDTRLILKLDIVSDVEENLFVRGITVSPDDVDFLTAISLVENNLADLFYRVGADKELPIIKFKDKSCVAVKIINKDVNLRPAEFPQIWPEIGNIRINLSNSPFSVHSIISSCDDNIELATANIYNFLKDKPMGDYMYKTDIGSEQ